VRSVNHSESAAGSRSDSPDRIMWPAYKPREHAGGGVSGRRARGRAPEGAFISRGRQASRASRSSHQAMGAALWYLLLSAWPPCWERVLPYWPAPEIITWGFSSSLQT